jgi:flagellar assembly factor FliW
MTVESTRFGTLDVTQDAVIELPEGLLGFETVTQYCLVEHAPGSPFRWLQAVADPALAFVAVNPYDFFHDYEMEIADADMAWLGIATADEVSVLTLVTVAGPDVTTNLVGPVVVNRLSRIGKQIILANAPYGTRHALARSAAAA